MSQGLTVYSASNAVSVIETMGRAIAKSQFIKCENVEQGIVLAMTCYSKGMDFLTLAQKYDLIGGRLSMKSDAMLSGLRERGGKHKIVKRTADEACVLLIYDGQEYESRMTWEDAKGEPFIYAGKESETLRFIEAKNEKELAKRLKPKYATPRARMQMLWARAVSDGVRALCPEVNTGTYTPEEVSDFEDCSASSPVVSMNTGVTVSGSSASAAAVEDAEFVEAKAIAGPGVELASGAQIARMTELFKLLKVGPEQQLKAFQSTGAYDLGSLTAGGADLIIGKLEARLNGAKIADKIVEHLESKAEAEAIAAQAPTPPALPESAASADSGEAATPEQIALIKPLLEKASQQPGQSGIALRIKEHINKHGIYKLDQMTAISAQRLIESLNGTAGIDDFFDVMPQRHDIPF